MALFDVLAALCSDEKLDAELLDFFSIDLNEEEEEDVVVVVVDFFCTVWMVFFLLTCRTSMASMLMPCWTSSLVSTCSNPCCCCSISCCSIICCSIICWRCTCKTINQKPLRDTGRDPLAHPGDLIPPQLTIIICWYFAMASSVLQPSASPSSAARRANSALWEPGGVQPTPLIQFRSDL